MKIRKYLSASGLFKLVRSSFEQIKDHRTEQAEIALADALMCGFSLFFLKEPSLLAFDDRRRDDPENLHSIYQIEQIACDTQLRTILDDVESESLRPAFKEIFRALQRGKELEAFQFLEGHYLLSLDSTGYFSSHTIHCKDCLEKHLRNGETLYHHQMLGAAIVHPICIKLRKGNKRTG